MMLVGLFLALRLWAPIETLGTLGDVIVGAVTALAASYCIEQWKRVQLGKDLASALYYELANRVAMCVVHFESPWSDRWENAPKELTRFDAGKFVPDQPVVFNSNADKLALLTPGVPGALMGFYFRLRVLDRDIANAREKGATASSYNIGQENTKLIARRFGATLFPGKAALVALARDVPEHLAIEAEALDTMDPEKRRFTRTLREHLDEQIVRRHEIRKRLGEVKD
jgi:hypothetical protein